MNYQIKQEWLEAVMASSLGAATKVYAYGIFQHMYGNKDSAWPGAKALMAATGMARGKFYLHNKALEEAGFLKVTHRSGRSNEYQLCDPPTEVSGTHPQMEQHPPTEEATPATFVGTNTTKKTVKKTTTEDNKTPATPVATVREEPEDSSPLLITLGEDGRYWFNGKPYVWKKYAEEAKREYEVEKVWADEDV